MKHNHEHTASDGASRLTASQLIETVLTESAEPQLDIYYKTRAEELCATDPDAIECILRTMQRHDPGHIDPLVRLLHHVGGFSHIQFLQDFVKNQIFLPRTGLLILDIFNRCDVMLESGIASMLLDFDNLCQRIRHAVTMDTLDEQLLNDCAALPDNRRQGLLLQLLAESGDDAPQLLALLLQAGGDIADEALRLLTTEPTAKNYALLQSAYQHSPAKSIAKQMKRIAC